MENRCHICGKTLPATESRYHVKCMRRVFHSATIPVLDYSQDELNELAKSIISERISVPGVQPKLSLHLEKGNTSAHSRLTLVGLEGDYILKPQTPQWPHLPEAEHCCMLFARQCRINTVDFGLIPLKSGELAYITRRMDRTEHGALHMEDFCQLTNKLTAQKYHGSMEQIGRALRQYSSVPGLDAVRLLELTIFCYLTGNSDMHLKNFSLMQMPDRHWELTPAYDLVPVKIILPADKEELALTLAGKKSNLKYADFVCFSESLGLTTVQFERTLKNLLKRGKAALDETLESSFMKSGMRRKFRELFLERTTRLRE